MDFFPDLELSVFGGWLFILCIAILQPSILLIMPKKVRSRLLDRSNFTRDQKILTGISKFIVLMFQIILIFSPLKIGLLEFYFGLFLILLGIIGEVIAVINFKKTPLNEPVTRGIYKYSRNPQETMLSIAFFGACFAVGSWFLFFLFGFSRIFNHFHILAQEQACLNEYGEDYKKYMKEVPRYFLFL
ncbi:MAG: methyltransferase family protein [Candidatus Thorarchaeota archaeon]